ncbi:MAG: NAD(P)H-hydrate dehydratase [Gammaproteobacteria bacterium]|nr:NAD(P)H-hydrate dehydratase [Gammaproteobacteria bacterium]NIR84419.1 NAD(P)H-hydrate dehydratase [Gammaproteobacteria bacterium]NIR90900.1 NAD(P)H-hydrate dehydratase [Gammaproteobacteria bacterium]NIU07086.1 NAD(P)H-hydrate dehydratase [Gammaproteobacteria bacterium]NIV76215.1 NAD(P)H-hydrate dehydratase [Gammaproteobacteria bacterium]
MSVNAPSALPVDLYRAEHVQALDRVAIERFGIPGIELMERAGRAAYRAMRERWPGARRIGVFCGLGNNGGDGHVVARRAHEAGLKVQVWQLGDPERITGAAAEAYQRLIAAGVRPVPFERKAVPATDVVVDALFGTGIARDVGGAFAEAVDAINASGAGVLAIDIPSGLHADTGCVLGVAVRADVTVSFIGLKQGMFTGEGRGCSGNVLFDGLRVPAETYAEVERDAQRLEYAQFQERFRPRPRAAHKGHFGHVLVVGGELGFAGAARMAGEAAARTGAGLVSVATRPAHAAAIAMTRPELMCRGVESAEDLAPLLERATVVALGPGLGLSEWSQAMLEAALGAERPLVVDADGLNLMARMGSPPGRPAAGWVLTPHPGEAARLLGTRTSEVQADRFAAVRGLGERYDAVVVLKGAGTLVLESGQLPGVCDGGNPGMASGGMGDVLTGIIAGLVAQGHALADAARAGTCLHARAADLAAAEDGERGMLAGDLLPHLRRLVNPRPQAPSRRT